MSYMPAVRTHRAVTIDTGAEWGLYCDDAVIEVADTGSLRIWPAQGHAFIAVRPPAEPAEADDVDECL